VTDASPETGGQQRERNADALGLQDVIGIVVGPLPQDCSQVGAVGRTIREYAIVDAVRVNCIPGNRIGARAVPSAQRKQGCKRNNERQQQPKMSAMRHADLSHGSAERVNDSALEGWQFDAGAGKGRPSIIKQRNRMSGILPSR
jgi:hypothetical protein